VKWFRFYHDALDDPKVQRLPGDLFKFWINLLCLASRAEARGVIAADPDGIGFATRISTEEAGSLVAELVRRGLLEETADGLAIHNWQTRQFASDDVSARVAKHRMQNDETLHETPDETFRPLRAADTEEIQSTDTDSDSEEISRGGGDAPPPARKSGKTPIPEDWQPKPRTVKKAMDEEERSYAEVEGQVERFVCHHLAQGNLRADWDRAFLSWIQKMDRFEP
jgi:hypothetical protein